MSVLYVYLQTTRAIRTLAKIMMITAATDPPMIGPEKTKELITMFSECIYDTLSSKIDVM